MPDPTPATPGYYPPPAFSFGVYIAGSGSSAQQPVLDAAFQEVSGVESHVTVEEVPEGGQNAYVHQVPGVTKHGNLVLKRGYMTKDSRFARWSAQTVGSSLGTPIVTQVVNVCLLGATGQPVVTWTFSNAWPVKWEATGFNAKSNDVLIESIELAYTTVTCTVATS
jgi:phage tail-like protein